MSDIIRAGHFLDLDAIGNELLRQRAELAAYVSRLLKKYETRYRPPTFFVDNEWLEREASYIPNDINHCTFFRAKTLCRDYGRETVLEDRLMQSVHREHETSQYLYVAKGHPGFSGIDIAVMDLLDTDGDRGVPAETAIAVHYNEEPAFLATEFLGVTTMFAEPQVAFNKGYDQPWAVVLDRLWQNYLYANPLKTDKDFRQKHGHR